MAGMLRRSFLVRGLLAGLLAGVVAFGVAYVVGEPRRGRHRPRGVRRRPSHADEAGPAPPRSRPAPRCPRSLQSTPACSPRTAVAGATLGGLVGVLSALALGRFGGLGVRGSTLLVAGIGFVALRRAVLAYPPNPPAVGQAETIGTRTALYFATVAISVVAAVTAVLVARRLAARVGSWSAALAGVAGYLLVVLGGDRVCCPGYDEVPADFPATVLYDFRIGSLAHPARLVGRPSGSFWPSSRTGSCTAPADSAQADPR